MFSFVSEMLFHASHNSLCYVLIEERGCVRVLTLNRPKQLNALSIPMVCNMVGCFCYFLVIDFQLVGEILFEHV